MNRWRKINAAERRKRVMAKKKTDNKIDPEAALHAEKMARREARRKAFGLK